MSTTDQKHGTSSFGAKNSKELLAIDDLVLGVDFRPYLTHPTPPPASSDKKLLLGHQVVSRVVDMILNLGYYTAPLTLDSTLTAYQARTNLKHDYASAQQVIPVLNEFILKIAVVTQPNGKVLPHVAVSAGKKQDSFIRVGVTVHTQIFRQTSPSTNDSNSFVGGQSQPSDLDHEIAQDQTLKSFRQFLLEASADPAVRGIIVQMPVPPAYQSLLNLIPINKDIDALNPNNQQLGATAEVACSLVEIFSSPNGQDFIDIPSDIVLLGNQGFVGASVGKGLLARGLSFVGFDKKNGGQGVVFRPYCGTSQITACLNLEGAVRKARIIVSATGCCGSITSSMLLGVSSQSMAPEKSNSNLPRAKSLVVDAGFSKDPQTGAISGDVHKDVYLTPGTVTHLTPVPCGVGPLEMAVLLLRFAKSCADYEEKSNQQQRDEEGNFKNDGESIRQFSVLSYDLKQAITAWNLAEILRSQFLPQSLNPQFQRSDQ